MPNLKATSRKITQELDKLQRQITTKLERYYKQNIKGSQLPAEFIRQNDKQIKGIIRDTVQSSWLFAHGIISDIIADRVDLTTKDIQGIESLTNSFEEQFWALSHKLLTRDTEFKVSGGEYIELTPFDVHAGFIGLGGWFAYYAFNYSVESKAGELGGIVKLKFVTREQCIDTQICLPLNGTLYNVGEVPFQLPLHKHCKCRLIPVLSQP